MLIPALFNESDAQVARVHFGEFPVARVREERINAVARVLGNAKLWLDCELDGCHNPKKGRSDEWLAQLQSLDGADDLLKAVDGAKLLSSTSLALSEGVLKRAADKGASWVSIPQLPLADGPARDKLNRSLANGAAEADVNDFKGTRVLPVILTHHSQYKGKPVRRQRVEKTVKLATDSRSGVVWVCDSSLSDSDGTSTFDTERFPDLIALHEELKEKLPREMLIVAGPYWGMGLILWARGLVNHSIAGVGRGYQYHVAGGKFPRSGSVRVAVPPLRRLVDATPSFRSWLESSLNEIPPNDPSRPAFQKLLGGLSVLERNRAKARQQVAEFYWEWVSGFSSAPARGRQVALYQDLSSAYVVGKPLPDLPGVNGPSKRPERIAQQYMMHCL
jgi:hypothetical protein